MGKVKEHIEQKKTQKCPKDIQPYQYQKNAN